MHNSFTFKKSTCLSIGQSWLQID